MGLGGTGKGCLSRMAAISCLRVSTSSRRRRAYISTELRRVPAPECSVEADIIDSARASCPAPCDEADVDIAGPEEGCDSLLFCAMCRRRRSFSVKGTPASSTMTVLRGVISRVGGCPRIEPDDGVGAASRSYVIHVARDCAKTGSVPFELGEGLRLLSTAGRSMLEPLNLLWLGSKSLSPDVRSNGWDPRTMPKRLARRRRWRNTLIPAITAIPTNPPTTPPAIAAV